MRQGQSLKVKLRLSLWLRRSLTLRRLGGAKFWRQNQVKQRQIGGLIVLQFAFASLGPAAGRASRRQCVSMFYINNAYGVVNIKHGDLVAEGAIIIK